MDCSALGLLGWSHKQGATPVARKADRLAALGRDGVGKHGKYRAVAPEVSVLRQPCTHTAGQERPVGAAVSGPSAFDIGSASLWASLSMEGLGISGAPFDRDFKAI